MKRISLMVLLTSLLLFSIARSPLAGPQGTNRPLTGTLMGAATFAFGDAECVPVNVVGVKTITVAEGNVSHLGKAQALFSHCPGPPYKNGQLTLKAANGDELWGTYEDDDGAPPFVVHIAGGTGRFNNAQGVFNLYWSVEWVFDDAGNPDWSAAWPWWATVEGTISY